MSAATQARYRDAHRDALHDVLRAWLSALPPAGWEGGVSDLEGELSAVADRRPVPPYIPRGSGLVRTVAAELPFIERCGYAVEFRRTKRERTLRFARVA